MKATQPHRLVAFEGPPTAGKTMCARKFAAHFHTERLLEPTPRLLVSFYADTKPKALVTQIYYLQRRIRHAQKARFLLSKGSQVCMDYAFWKDLVYARQFMDKREYVIYRGLYQSIEDFWVTPSVLVLLDCRTDVIMRRLRSRRRKGEERLTAQDVAALRSHAIRLARIQKCPVIRIDTTSLPIDTSALARNILFHKVVDAVSSAI